MPRSDHPAASATKPRYAAIDLIAGYTLVAPQALGFAVFVLLPIAAVFSVSFFDWNLLSGQINFAGFKNYVETLPRDTRAAGILRNTAVFVLGFMPLTVVCGLALAVLTNRQKPGMHIYRAIFFMPVVVSLAAWAIIWRMVFQPEGPLNAFLKLFGAIGPNWLANKQFALATIILVAFLKTVGFTMVLFHAALQNVPRDVIEAARIDGAGDWQIFRNITLPLIAPFTFLVAFLKTVGFTMVLFHAALQNVPRDVIEAARIDGAGDWQIFRNITLPLIAPFTFLVVILTTINSFKTFALFYVMTQGGPGDATRTLSLYIYDMGFKFLQLGYAGTLSVLLFLIILTLTLIQFVVRGRWVHNET